MDKPKLPAIPSVPSEMEFREATLAAYSVNRTIADMTPTHAQAVADATRNQYAVPARQETARHALTVGLIAIVAIWLLWLLSNAVNTNSNVVVPLLTAIVAVVAVLGAEPIVKAVLKQLKKPPTLE